MEPDLVQLRMFEIDRSLLSGPGESLDDCLRPFGSPRVELLDDGPIPTAGWRVIDREAASGGSVIAAAPFCDDSGDVGQSDTYVLLFLNRDAGRWTAVADPEPTPVTPSKEQRAAALTLTLPQSVGWTPGTVPELTVRLTNNGDRPFPEFEYDSLFAIAWLSDLAEAEFRPSGEFTYSGSDGLGTCLPTESVELPIQWTTADMETVPPGEYRINAMLTTVALRSNVASAHIEPAA